MFKKLSERIKNSRETKKIKRIEKEQKKEQEKFENHSTKSAIENITDSVIYETCSPNGKLYRDFERLTRNYNKDQNPINAAAAEDIIFSLLHSAMAARNNIFTRIEEATKNGMLVNQYNEKMHAIEEIQTQLAGIRKYKGNADEELAREKLHYDTIAKRQYKQPKNKFFESGKKGDYK